VSDFPTMVYRIPGAHRASGGLTFDYRGIDDAGALKAALADGWHLSLPEAIAGDAIEAIDDVSPATREELEQKARELGIGFNARTTDAVLAQRIAERV